MERILYSFPHRIGAGRICHLAWNQAAGYAQSGFDVTVIASSVARRLPPGIRVHTTLGAGPLRVPRRLLGRLGSCRWHDAVTAAWLRINHAAVDAVHCWPLGSLRTLRVARQFGIPTFLERPNAHTAFAFEAVERENRRVGIGLPSDHDHATNPAVLAQELEEYALADFLLCPSEFVAGTFRDRGFAPEKLLRHQYGFDPEKFHLGNQNPMEPLVALFAGVCEPRKGLHTALEAWLASGAQNEGAFLICGEFVPGYRERLAGMLAHPRVRYLGQRSDLAEVMAGAHLFLLPSVEEGSALVTYEARAAGCVLLVSDASGAIGRHGDTALIHPAGDAHTLRNHIRRLGQDRSELALLRERSIAERPQLDWDAARLRLMEVVRRNARRKDSGSHVQPLVPAHAAR